MWLGAPPSPPPLCQLLHPRGLSPPAFRLGHLRGSAPRWFSCSLLPLGNPRKMDQVCINTKVCQVPGTQEAQKCVQGATLDPHPHFGKVIWKNPETLSGKCQLPLDLGQVPTSLALVGCFYEEPCPPSSQGWRRQHTTEMAGEGPTTCIAFHRLRKPVYPLLSWQGWEVSLQGSVDRTKPGYLPSTIVLNFAFLRNCEAPLGKRMQT